MHLGLRLNLYRSAAMQVPVEQVRLAEDLGYHSVWSAEAYGSDALSPLAYLAALTRRIKLGSAIAQLAARPPATLAMHAMTIDALAGGDRVIMGLGVSGPQIVEGWYGQPWGKPNARLRDYVAIVRKVLAREAPVAHDGPEISLPYTGPGALGQGKPLRSILHPVGRVSLWLAAGGPRNVELCGEISDGWLPMGFAPEVQLPSLRKGLAKRDAKAPPFEVFVNGTIELTDDVKAAIDKRKPLSAMYVGGMGSATHNFHREAMERQGFAAEAARIHELWMAGRKEEAVAAVPDAFVEKDMLLGDEQRIRRRWAEWKHPPEVTGVIVNAETEADLKLMAALRDGR